MNMNSFDRLKRMLEERRTKEKKEIKELTQSVAGEINEYYREYDINVKLEYGMNSIDRLERMLEERRTKEKKEIKELTQRVSEEINEYYREYDISVKWEYGNGIYDYFHCTDDRIYGEPTIRLIVEHSTHLKKAELIYGVHYIHCLIKDKDRNEFLELLKEIIEHINNYINGVEIVEIRKQV